MNFRVVQTDFHLGGAVFQIMRKLDEQIAWRAHFSAVCLKYVGHRFPCLSVQVINKVPEVHPRKSTLRIRIPVMATNSCGSKKQWNGVQWRK